MRDFNREKWHRLLAFKEEDEAPPSALHSFYYGLPDQLQEAVKYLGAVLLVGCIGFVIFVGSALMGNPIIPSAPSSGMPPWSTYFDPWLQTIRIDDSNVISDKDLDLLNAPAFAQVRHLRISRQKGISADGLLNVRHLKELRILELPNNNLTDAALREIGQLPKLEELDLSYNKITGEGLSLLKNATLKKLNLEKTEVRENFLLNLRLPETLKELNFFDTPIARKIGYNDHADTPTVVALRLRFPYTAIWFNRNRDWDQSSNFSAMTLREEDQVDVPVDSN